MAINNDAMDCSTQKEMTQIRHSSHEKRPTDLSMKMIGTNPLFNNKLGSPFTHPCATDRVKSASNSNSPASTTEQRKMIKNRTFAVIPAAKINFPYNRSAYLMERISLSKENSFPSEPTFTTDLH